MKPPPLKISHLRTRPIRPMRRRYGVEPLESRHLPSTVLPGISSTLPADGTVTIQPPQSFTIHFDQSVLDQVDDTLSAFYGIAPDSVLPAVVGSDFDQDVEIDQVSPGGATTPYLGGSSNSPVDETVGTTTAADGSTRSQLVVTLPQGSPAMLPGTYQISLLPTSGLAAAFAFVEPDSTWATATAPIPIAQFTVLARAATFAGATNLGTIGQATQTVSGIIEPSIEQSAVQLYQFSVPAGNRWQFDAQLDATSIESPLQSVLTLFDARGDVLATTGLVGDPIDPDLTTSLAAGTYFIGVSGEGNVPGVAGGYDPITGMPGSGGLSAPGGPFLLDLSATPVVHSTSLVDFQLDHGDVLETAPTGLDLRFSGPVDVDALATPDQQQTALSVVDSWGRTWPITAFDYQSSSNSLSFLFDEPLPPGRYSLVVPSEGGLTDLAGNPVVGPAGSPQGVLATWTVAAPAGPADPQNLGVIWPGSANVTISTGVTGSDDLAAGQVGDDRFVVICPGIYQVQTQIGTGSADVRIVGSDGAILLNTGSRSQLGDSYVQLTPGVYQFVLASTSTSPTAIDWSLAPKSLDYEKLLANGVSQTNALVLPMMGPFSENAGPASGTGASVGSVGSVGSASPVIPVAATSDGVTFGIGGSSGSEVGASSIPTALLVTMETGLAGSPSTGSGSESSVGPMAVAIAIPTTGAGRGQAMPIVSWRSSGTDPRVGEDDPAAPGTAPSVRVGSAQTDGASDPDAASARADAIALARGDRLVRFAGWFADRIDLSPTGLRGTGLPAGETGSEAPAAAATDAHAIAIATTDFRPARRHLGIRELAQADIGVPSTLLVATALTYRFSQPIRKWWRRRDPAHIGSPRPFTYRGRPRNPSTSPNVVIE